MDGPTPKGEAPMSAILLILLAFLLFALLPYLVPIIVIGAVAHFCPWWVTLLLLLFLVSR